ncbi:uncharacterized protein [Nicotiana sylvestris]|uniref:uncharacterized protein isoform X2 n=1 Tax=Nicotiana sylvestris TaxID=4096 RepID=UPI00388CA706
MHWTSRTNSMQLSINLVDFLIRYMLGSMSASQIFGRSIREDEYLDTPQKYRSFRVLDIIPTEEELNSMPLIYQLPCSRIRSKVLNAGPSTGESPRTLSRSKESNRTPVIGKSPRSRSRSKKANRTPFIGESSRTQSRSNHSTSDFDDNELLDIICSRLTMEVQRHAEKERSTIVKEVFDKFKKEERSAFVDAVFVKVKVYLESSPSLVTTSPRLG